MRAETREALERARMDVEVRLVTRFPRLAVRAVRRVRGLEARVRYGRRRLSPEETLEAVRLLSRREPPREAQPPSCAAPGTQGGGGGLRMSTVRLEGIPAAFWVGPAGVLAVAEFPSSPTSRRSGSGRTREGLSRPYLRCWPGVRALRARWPGRDW